MRMNCDIVMRFCGAYDDRVAGSCLLNKSDIGIAECKHRNRVNIGVTRGSDGVADSAFGGGSGGTSGVLDGTEAVVRDKDVGADRGKDKTDC